MDVPQNDTAQIAALLGHWIVQSAPKFQTQSLEFNLPFLAGRLGHDEEPAIAVATADVGEANEVERFGFPLAMFVPALLGKTTKFDQPCFIQV